MGTITQLSGTNSLFANGGTQATINKTDNPTASGGLTGNQDPNELKEQFLQILLVQLKNQNPLDPVDPTEFTNQLALYSSLEQQINMNSKFDNLLEVLQASSSGNAFAYIGNTAELSTNMSVVQDGKVDWKYSLGEDAKTVKVSVLDEQGRTLFAEDVGASPSGTYSLDLNAEDLSQAVEDGQILYFKIETTNMAGKSVNTQVSTTVVVDGVESNEDGINLRAGQLTFAIEDVSRILKTASAPASTPPAEDDPETPEV